MEGNWRENEEMERDSLSTFPHFSLLSPFQSFSYIKHCHILSQNVRYCTFVANVTKNLTYALWENNSGSYLLLGSSTSCAGLEDNDDSVLAIL